MPLPFQYRSDVDGDKEGLYPRQPRPEGYIKPKSKISSASMIDLLKVDANGDKPKTTLGAAFAAFSQVQANSAPEGGGDKVRGLSIDLLTHWKNYAVAKVAHDESLVRKFDGVLKNVNMDGLKQASRANTWKVKMFWLSLVFCMFGILLYEVVQCVRAYNASPITTKYTLLTPAAVDFPQVYLCYGNVMNRSYILEHMDQVAIAKAYRNRSAVTKGGNRRKRDLNYLIDQGAPEDEDEEDIIRVLRNSADEWEGNGDEESLSGRGRVERDHNHHENFLSEYISQAVRMRRSADGNSSSTNGTNSTEAAAEAARIEAMLNASNISQIVYDYFINSAYKVDKTFLECEFRTYKHEKLNCADIIKPVMDANYGVCFLVDLPNHLKQTVDGNGLRLLLNSHIDLYPQRDEGAPAYAGVLVSVNQHYDPFNWLKSLASPGHLTKIDLEASYVELLNLDSGPLIQPCLDEDAGRTRLKIFNGNYSRTMCQMDCLYEAHRNFCQCVLPVDKSQLKQEVLKDTAFCGPFQFKGCLASSAVEVEKMVNACRSECHTPCKSYRYEMRSSRAKLHDPAFEYLSLPPNVTARQLIELRVAFNRREIVQLIQSPSASTADLIANVGGQVNLWLGASLIALLQIMFSFIWYVLSRTGTNIHNRVKGR